VLDIRAFPIYEAGRVTSVLLLVSDITEKMAMQAEAIQAAHLARWGSWPPAWRTKSTIRSPASSTMAKY
jgi:hypothetical protein